MDRFDFHGEKDWAVTMSDEYLPFSLPFAFPTEYLGDIRIPDGWGNSLEEAGQAHSYEQIGDWSYRNKRVLINADGTLLLPSYILQFPD